MRPQIKNGWLMAPYQGPDTALVEIGLTWSVGKGSPTEWQAAFLDWDGPHRVCMIQHDPTKHGNKPIVFTRVAGVVQRMGGIV